MIRQRLIGLVLSLMIAGAAHAAGPSAGKVLFEQHCAVCHAAGVGHPGTQRLAELHGADHSVLEQRTDLAPEYIRYVVRHGLIEMPPWRPTEIDDAQLQKLIAYLTRKP